MKRSLIRSVIVTGGAMVGITTTVTTGPASAWGEAATSGPIDMSSGPIAASTPQPQTSAPAVEPTAQAAAQPSAAATKAPVTKKKPTKKKPSTPATQASSTPTSNSSNTSGGSQDGTFTGSPTPAGRYGYVQVRIQVNGGSITAIDVLQAPSGRSQQFTDFSVPTLIDEAMNSQSASIATVGGASFTSRAFKSSLQSALSKAGM